MKAAYQPINISTLKSPPGNQLPETNYSPSPAINSNQQPLPAPGNVQESLLEYLDATTSVRKPPTHGPSASSSASTTSSAPASTSFLQGTATYKTVQDKVFFDGLTNWIDSIYARLRYLPLPNGLLASHDFTSQSSQNLFMNLNNEPLFYKGSNGIPLSARTSFEGSISRIDESYGVKANNPAFSGPIDPSKGVASSQEVVDDDYVLIILQETEELLFTLSSEDDLIDMDNLSWEYNDLTSDRLQDAIARIKRCLCNAELAISWLRYHIHQNDFDAPSSAGGDITQTLAHVSKSVTKQQHISNSIIQPKQLFLYAYRVIHLMEQFGKLKIWAILAISSQRAVKLSTGLEVANIVILLRLLRLLVSAQVIHCHIHLVNQSLPSQLSHISRHVPSSVNEPIATNSSGKYAGKGSFSTSHGNARYPMKEQSGMNPIFTKLISTYIQLARDMVRNAPQPSNPSPPSLQTEDKSMVNSMQVEGIIQELDAVIISTDLLSNCSISAITGQHYHVHSSHGSFQAHATAINQSTHKRSNQSPKSFHSMKESINPMPGDWESDEILSDDSMDDIEGIISRLQSPETNLERIKSIESTSSDASGAMRRKRSSSGANPLNAHHIVTTMEIAMTLVSSLPSPSYIRSKLCYSVCKYLEIMRKGRLPWQQFYNKYLKGSAMGQASESAASSSPSMTVGKAHIPVISPFGVSNAGIIITKQYIEGKIFKLCEQTFDISDHLDMAMKHQSASEIDDEGVYSTSKSMYIERLLMFESAADIFLTSSSSIPSTNKTPSNPSQFKSNPGEKNASGAIYRIDSIESQTGSESNLHRMASIQQEPSDSASETLLDRICLSLPISLDLSRPFHLSVDSSTASGLSKDSEHVLMMNYERNIRLYQSQDISLYISLIFTYFARLLIESSSQHAYAMMDINYQLMRRSNSSLYDSNGHWDSSPTVLKVKRELLMLSSRQSDQDRILETSLFLLERLCLIESAGITSNPLIMSPISSNIRIHPSNPATTSFSTFPETLARDPSFQITSPIAFFEENIVEIKFLMESVLKSYIDVGLYEKAGKAIHEFVQFLTYRVTKAIDSCDMKSSKYFTTIEKLMDKYHKVIDPFMMKLGRLYIDAGTPNKAVIELQKYLEILLIRKNNYQQRSMNYSNYYGSQSSSSNGNGLSNSFNPSAASSSMALSSNVLQCYDLIIATLTWLYQGYWDMNNMEVCKKIMTMIKNIRNDLSITQANSPPPPTPSQSSKSNHSVHLGPSNGTGMSGMAGIATPATTGSSSFDLGYDGTTNTDGSDTTKSTRRREYSISERSSNSKKSSDRGSDMSGSNSFIVYNLPKVGVTQYNIDLGEAVAQIHFKSQGYVAALKSLVSTIIGMELSARYLQNMYASDILESENVTMPSAGKQRFQPTAHFVSSMTEAKAELARLYYLRGEIQLEAAKSSVVKYPFTIGSSQLFAAIHLVYEQIGLAPKQGGHYSSPNANYPPYKAYTLSNPVNKAYNTNNYPSFGNNSNIRPMNLTNPSNELAMTCQNSMQYKSPSDLLWDAMKWFQRAWDLYDSIDNCVNASKAANKLAACHLEALYIPCVFFQKTKHFAGDLGSSGAAAAPVYSSWGAGDEELEEPQLQSNYSPSRQFDRQFSVNSDVSSLSGGMVTRVLPRTASIEEISRAIDYSLSLSSDCCVPMNLLEAYLSMAEAKLLQDESFEAIAYWWEARELFMHLFVDGISIPILRRASVVFALRLGQILDRLVRFLWASERPLLNQNLVLLDMHILCSYEIDRVVKQAVNRSNQVSSSLDRILENLRDSSANMTAIPSNPDLFLSNQYLPIEFKNILNTWSSYALNGDLFASIGSNVLEKIAHFSKNDPYNTLQTGSLSSHPSSPKTVTSLQGKVITPTTSISANDGLATGKDINAAVLAGAAAAKKAERSTVGFGDDSSVAASEKLRDRESLRDREMIRSNGLFLWTLEGFVSMNYSIMSDPNDDEARLASEEAVIENMWRCMSLIEFYVQKTEKSMIPYQLNSNDSIGLVRNICRRSLSSMSIIMRRYRNLTRQHEGESISYDHLTRTFVKKVTIDDFVRLDSANLAAVNTTKKAIMMQDRMQHIVYCLKIDELLMMYRPYAGTQYIQPFGSSGYITYAEKSQAWLILQNAATNTRSNDRRRGSSLGPGNVEISLGNNMIGENYLSTMSTSNAISTCPPVDNMDATMIPSMASNNMGFGITIDDTLSGGFGVAMSFDMDGIPITSNIGRDRGYSRQSLPDINNAANNPSGALFPSIEEESYNEDAIGVRAPGFRSDLEDENDGFGFKLSPDVGADQRSTNYQPSSPSAIMLPTNSDLTPPPGLGLPSNGSISRLKSAKYNNRSSRSIQSWSSNGSGYAPTVRTSHPIPQEYLNGPPSGSNLPSYASIASSTTCARIPKSTAFSSDQSKLLFDLAIEMNDASCGGGLEGRKSIFEQMRRSDFLRGALEFLRDAEYDPTSPSDESSYGSNSSFSHRRPMMSHSDDNKKYNAFLPSGFLRLFQSKNEANSPPCLPSPVTLICSKTTHAIPWELLSIGQAMDLQGLNVNRSTASLTSNKDSSVTNSAPSSSIVIVRQSSLMTMFAFVKLKGGNYLTGPAWHQAPIYLSVAQGINGLPIRLASDIKAREVSRRIVSSIQSIETLTHKVSHLVRASKSLILTSSPIVSASSDDIHRRYSNICQSLQDRIYPCPSALLPLGKISAQTLRSRRLKKFGFYDLSGYNAQTNSPSTKNYSSSQSSSQSFKSFLNWIDQQISSATVTSSLSHSPLATPSTIGNNNNNTVNQYSSYQIVHGIFPVIILSYADLLELSETVTLLMMTRGDAILVFAPHFCQGTVAKEIVRCFDAWCPVSASTATPTAPVSSSGQLSLMMPTANSGVYGGVMNSNSIKSNRPPPLITSMDPPLGDPSIALDSPMSTASKAMPTGASLMSQTMTVNGSIYEPTDVDLSNKTLAYHSIMDTVNRLQQELFVPIVVFI